MLPSQNRAHTKYEISSDKEYKQAKKESAISKIKAKTAKSKAKIHKYENEWKPKKETSKKSGDYKSQLTRELDSIIRTEEELDSWKDLKIKECDFKVTTGRGDKEWGESRKKFIEALYSNERARFRSNIK